MGDHHGWLRAAAAAVSAASRPTELVIREECDTVQIPPDPWAEQVAGSESGEWPVGASSRQPLEISPQDSIIRSRRFKRWLMSL